MTYFYLVAYFLVVILIQDGVAQTDPCSIWSNIGTISPGDSYTISCKSQYTFWFYKNTGNPGYVASEVCGFARGISKEEYECEHEKRGKFYHANLTIKHERSPTTVEWKCAYTIDRKTHSSKPIHIEIRRDVPPPTTRQRTSSPTESPRQSSPLRTTSSSSSASNKDPRTPRRPSSTNTPVGQPPVTTPSGTTTIILIAICCAVGVLILLITIFAVMFLHNKRKQKRTKRGPIRPVANRPSADAAAAAIGTYDIVDDTSPPRNDFGDDFGNTYDTADSFAPPTSRITDPNYDTTEGDAPQASTNPNIDPSKFYGVVNKKDPVADTKDSYGEAEAGVNNPNFDPDKVYGVVNKSAKCQNPVSESTTENIYVNQ